MFDHVKFGVTDYEASKAFYLRALAPLGIRAGHEGPPSSGIELLTEAEASLCLFQTDQTPAHLHIAFTAQSRQQVDEFHACALAAGGTDNGAPGIRPQYSDTYYAAFIRDPDGHNIEMVCHAAE
ncbi:VOC family protein [Loktanella sp. DJP18]|uniref:VOC family protein n=1 Tax=Loktanella sp. DJP18 TaxID=3409788 RepID=UPI003BB5249B